MELWQLRTFRAVARTLHFTRASEELNLSQPAVSHQIKALEDEIAEPLFFRGGDGITLTPAGEVMLEHAHRILAIADQIKLEIEESRRDPRGKLVIGVVNRGISTNFPMVYREFRNAHPDVELGFRSETDVKAVQAAVMNGSIDIGVLAAPPDPKRFDSVPFGRTKMLFFVGEGHRLANSERLDPAELSREVIAMFDPGDPMRTAIETSLAVENVSPKSEFVTNDGNVIKYLVEEGEMVAFLPTAGIAQMIRQSKLVRIPAPELECGLDVYMIWKKGRKSPAIVSFIRYILNADMPGVYRSSKEKGEGPR